MTKISVPALCNELQMMSIPRTCQNVSSVFIILVNGKNLTATISRLTLPKLIMMHYNQVRTDVPANEAFKHRILSHLQESSC